MGKWQKHIQASQEVSHFSADDHKAAMKRQESMTNTKLSLNTFSFFFWRSLYLKGGGGGVYDKPPLLKRKYMNGLNFLTPIFFAQIPIKPLFSHLHKAGFLSFIHFITLRLHIHITT